MIFCCYKAASWNSLNTQQGIEKWGNVEYNASIHVWRPLRVDDDGGGGFFFTGISPRRFCWFGYFQATYMIPKQCLSFDCWNILDEWLLITLKWIGLILLTMDFCFWLYFIWDAIQRSFLGDFFIRDKESHNHKVYFESGFLQEHAVSVKIVNHERRRRLGRATFNAYLYTVEVDHGDYNWTVFRTWEKLAHDLSQCNIPFHYLF